MDLIRAGIVSSINAAACSARVTFSDRSDLVSFELPIIVRGSMETRDYWMPVVGEQVICVFLPTNTAQGFILGSIYSEKDVPPVTDANKRHIAFSDGTTIEYDAVTHALTVNALGAVNITAAGSVHVTGDVIADGVSLKTHTHSGVTVGSGNSGPPVGGA